MTTIQDQQPLADFFEKKWKKERIEEANKKKAIVALIREIKWSIRVHNSINRNFPITNEDIVAHLSKKRKK